LPEDEGLVVTAVDANSTGEQAGLKAKDVLVKIGAKAVPSDSTRLAKLLTDQNLAEPIDLVVLREGREETIKEAKMPNVMQAPALPDGVTVVTREHLATKIPNDFYYDYQFPPEPGKRVWIRVTDRQFIERYPNGKETTFNILGRATVEQREGTLVIRTEAGNEVLPAVPTNEFRVFIADKTLEIRRLYYSHPQVNSGKWVFLGEMKGVK
jgi:hypothetical protein